MKQLKPTGPASGAAPLSPDQAALTAAVARELLTRPESGVTRISYVGLPGRQTVQLIIDARYDGLHAQTTRGQSGRVSVTLSAAAEAEAAASGVGAVAEAADAVAAQAAADSEAPGARADAPGAGVGAWARLRAAGRRLACLLGGETL